MTRLSETLDAIDAANSKDPTLENGQPAALLYGRRMSERLAQFQPDASEPLQIAIRGQHIERWTIARSAYPMDKAGYYAWRNALKEVHADRLEAIMREKGYDDASIARVRSIVRKERVRSDAEAQTLEDIAALVFLEHYAADFAPKYEEAKVIDILRKTWRKMSEAGHAAALKLPLAPGVGAVVQKALAA
ncbi:MAG: DUF4202 domain-containing protein [Hyphomicrobiales bacterium]|nr:DUF4202 domain-containing protein [Hyphomicrobiales bacterium]